jgi:hypothetical protein
VSTENWRYFPEKESSNHANFFTDGLCDDGSKIVLHEVSSNRKFAAEF